jgi:formylglycine-generating enzyme required for sulfatase activity
MKKYIVWGFIWMTFLAFSFPAAAIEGDLSRDGTVGLPDAIMALQVAVGLRPSGNEPVTNSLGMTFVPIPSGMFFMGSPEDEPGRFDNETLHPVRMEKPFYIMRTEVTQAQWTTVMGSNPSISPDCPNCPVENVSWEDVRGFIFALQQQIGGVYRLPTEAEWEYAARADTMTAFANGPIQEIGRGFDENLDKIGWYAYNASDGVQPVARKNPNAWGLFDMHGNVQEWCGDWFGFYLEPVEVEISRVVRGGNYSSRAMDCRSASRTGLEPDKENERTGFRLVADVLSAGSCQYEFIPNQSDFSAVGGDGSFLVINPDGCSWIAQSNENWIRITSESGTGNGQVSFSIDSYDGEVPRAGRIRIGDQSMEIVQAAACQYSVAPLEFEYMAEGAQGETIAVEIASGNDCLGWTAASSDEWITGVVPDTENGSVQFNVSQNDTYLQRIGTITVAGETVTIHQSNVENRETFSNSFGMKFVHINGGTFMMGSPEDEPQRQADETLHQVTLTQDFYMMTTEVTRGQWEEVLGTLPPSFAGCEELDCPATFISWDEIQEFIRVLNANNSVANYRLPTEAEWEYAARAGSETAFPNGPLLALNKFERDENLDVISWYIVNSSDRLYPGAQKMPNRWGIYDTHGNASEMVQDVYGPYPDGPVVDPTGPEPANEFVNRVVRGGHYRRHARDCRTAFRLLSIQPFDKEILYGFRLAADR